MLQTKLHDRSLLLEDEFHAVLRLAVDSFVGLLES